MNHNTGVHFVLVLFGFLYLLGNGLNLVLPAASTAAPVEPGVPMTVYLHHHRNQAALLRIVEGPNFGECAQSGASC